jgi:hypothetical protein
LPVFSRLRKAGDRFIPSPHSTNLLLQPSPLAFMSAPQLTAEELKEKEDKERADALKNTNGVFSLPVSCHAMHLN